MDQCETNPAPSPKKIVRVSATAPKDPSPTDSRSPNEKSVDTVNFDYSMKKFEADLKTSFAEAGVTNELESLVVLINLLLDEKGFRQVIFFSAYLTRKKILSVLRKVEAENWPKIGEIRLRTAFFV